MLMLYCHPLCYIYDRINYKFCSVINNEQIEIVDLTLERNDTLFWVRKIESLFSNEDIVEKNYTIWYFVLMFLDLGFEKEKNEGRKDMNIWHVYATTDLFIPLSGQLPLLILHSSSNIY